MSDCERCNEIMCGEVTCPEPSSIPSKVLNCGESATTLSLTITPVANGLCGEGIFIFTGEGNLPRRSRRRLIDIINKNATDALLRGENPISFAIPVNREYHLPLTIWVGNAALNILIQEINDGKYEYFRYSPFIEQEITCSAGGEK